MSSFNRVKAFTFTLPASASNVAVTYADAFPANKTYVVICTPEYTTANFVTVSTKTGFTFNVGTTNGYDQTINCFAYME